MSRNTLTEDAANCRSCAKESNGRPEKAFLLRLASEFENLADAATTTIQSHQDDCCYFAQRASQETKAAVDAKHPIARLAHLIMARRYDDLSRDRQV